MLCEDVEVPRLQLELQALELRLESLCEEKDDLERSLVVFNRRHSDALGSLLGKVLQAQAELAALEAESSRRRAVKGQTSELDAEEDAQQAEQARREWQDYCRDYTEAQAAPAPESLNAQEEAELKRLYRKASSLCHPDKFADREKVAAHQAFVALQALYKINDLEGVRKLHDTLKVGGLSVAAPRSSTLSRVDSLRAAIAELKCRITETLRALQGLRDSEAAVLMRKAGPGESDWPAFFQRQARLLEAELARLEQAIAAHCGQHGL